MHYLIKNNEDGIRQLCIKYNVKSLFAFGSITTDEFKDESDVDLLVSFMPMTPEDYADNYFDLVDSLEALLKRPIDLVTEKSLRNPYFIDSINKAKSKIYEA
jgi:predicted nucleotidyltransferase